MKYIIGIDAGGTKTECVLVSEDLKVIHTLKTEGFNLSFHGIEHGYRVVKKLLDQLKPYLKEEFALSGISIAAAGAGRQELRTSFLELLNKNFDKEYEFVRIVVTTDAEAALEGAFSGKPGFILISGTGSILFGKDEKGNVLRCGGYGRILGDAGSGFSIGRKAFIYLSEVVDKIKIGSEFSSSLFSKYMIKNIDDLISLVNNPSFNIAEAALMVFEAAENKDKEALKIIQEESDSLCKLLKGIQNQTVGKNLNISLCGSIIATENIFSKILLNKIAHQLPEVTITKPEHSPAVGAAIMLLKDI